ncbi:TadE/TadG family type IV pilus assembly protein [Mesorhizobium sp. SP-1A]|uniref:TadE/TadG family type IV pilus assembly protein n=1 Tax=Mesorhizobium sp. SP-1A TaxID=3077840 RepID=UPI0028F6FEA9|nr:TadE/TadG family type IV pilus assembly protein [Mesorhizobium sp. SP-1A]
MHRHKRRIPRFFPKILSKWKDDKGASAIEFAMLAPLFILLILGMVAYGIYFGASHSIQQLAADAARTAISGLDAAERKQLVDKFLAANAAGYAFVDATKLKVEANDSSADPNQFEVSVLYDARNLPIWNLLPDLPMPGRTIARHSTIRMGGI